MYFTSPSRTALRKRRRTPALPRNERGSLMGSISSIFDLFTDAIFGFIDAGSAAANGFLTTGSDAANGFGDIVEGALGSITE